MVDDQNTTSLVALLVACLAFVVATGQLIQQVYMTADGYRKCQASVIGQWAKHTHLKWRWSEFRFETLYTTPLFAFNQVPDSRDALDCFPRVHEPPAGHNHGLWWRITDPSYLTHPSQYFITGSQKSEKLTLSYYTPHLRRSTRNKAWANDSTSWLRLLSSLHFWQRETFYTSEQPIVAGSSRNSTSLGAVLAGNDYLVISPEIDVATNTSSVRTLPTVTLVERSWDFMPPGIVRPLAQISVGDLIVVAHRLGMRWRDLDPAEGKLRAEGNGHSITSSLVHGYGVIVQYNTDRALWSQAKSTSDDWQMIPSAEADKLLCGIIPGCRALCIKDFHLASELDKPKTFDDMLDYFYIPKFGISPEGRLQEAPARVELLDTKTDSTGLLWEILGMICPFMPVASSPIVRIVLPIATPQRDTPATAREGLFVYRHRLEQFLSNVASDPPSDRHSMLRDLVNRLDDIDAEMDSFEQDQLTSEYHAQKHRQFVEKIRICFDRVTEHLVEWSNAHESVATKLRREGGWYRRLIGAYLVVNSSSHSEAKENLRRGPPRHHGTAIPEYYDELRVERAHLHVDAIQDVIKLMADGGYHDLSQNRHACWLMMIRAVLWNLSVVVSPGGYFPPVPSHFYGSLTPLYIT